MRNEYDAWKHQSNEYLPIMRIPCPTGQLGRQQLKNKLYMNEKTF